MRPGRPAATAPRLARSLAQGGRAGRAGCAREVPAQLAGDRQALEPAGGARPAAGARAAGFPVGERGSAATRSQLPARLARPALRDRRARLGGRRSRPGRGLLPGRRAGARSPGRRRSARGRGARPDPRGAWTGSRVLVRPARRGRARGGAGAARALGSRVVGRGDERCLDAAPRRPPVRSPATGA